MSHCPGPHHPSNPFLVTLPQFFFWIPPPVTTGACSHKHTSPSEHLMCSERLRTQVARHVRCWAIGGCLVTQYIAYLNYPCFSRNSWKGLRPLFKFIPWMSALPCPIYTPSFLSCPCTFSNLFTVHSQLTDVETAPFGGSQILCAIQSRSKDGSGAFRVLSYRTRSSIS